MQKMNLWQFLGSNFVPNCDTTYSGYGETRMMEQTFGPDVVVKTSLATSTYILMVRGRKVATGILTTGNWGNVCRLATICEFVVRKRKSIGAKVGMAPLGERGEVLQESRWATLASTRK